MRAALKPVSWTCVAEEDLAPLLIPDRHGGTDGQFRKAACAQLVYFAPGSATESYRLRTLIQRLGEPWPGPDRVEAALRSYGPLRFHAWERTADRWWLRYTGPEDPPEDPFRTRRWRLRVDGRAAPVDLSGVEVTRFFGLFPLLNGEHPLEALQDACAGDPRMLAALVALARTGLVGERPDEPWSVADLPELTFLGHAALAVRADDTLLLVDPAFLPETAPLDRPGRRRQALLSRATAVLISHHHWDHLQFQTLVHLPRDVRMLVPRVRVPRLTNPPIARYLRALGFTRVEELDPWEVVDVGPIRLRTAPFHGEAFGRDSVFDALTYHLTFGGRTLYGSVDAWQNEASDMSAVSARVASWGPLDWFLVGCSGQRHTLPIAAAGARYLSNELLDHPELLRYHAAVDDAERWARVLRPRAILPYAQFLFDGQPAPDLAEDELAARGPGSLRRFAARVSRSGHREWANALLEMSERTGIPVVLLEPMQGIVTGASPHRVGAGVRVLAPRVL